MTDYQAIPEFPKPADAGWISDVAAKTPKHATETEKEDIAKLNEQLTTLESMDRPTDTMSREQFLNTIPIQFREKATSIVAEIEEKHSSDVPQKAQQAVCAYLTRKHEKISKHLNRINLGIIQRATQTAAAQV